MILAGDVGGTNTRLALFEREPSRLRLVATADYLSHKYSGLDQAVALFLAEHAVSGAIESAAFGIAGPVEDGQRVQATNLPWVIERAVLSAKLNISQVALLNDLAANAYGTCWLRDDDLHVLNTGTSHPRSNKALIAAGTGLGEAGLVFADGGYMAVASEGGHCSLAPQREIEIELLQFLRKKYGHVSWERVVSGAGLVNIHEFLRQRGLAGKSTPELGQMPQLAGLDPAARISRAALLGIDPLAGQALDLFVGFYGAEAGNVALKFLATGAMYVGGGIAPKILDRLQQGGFMEAFVAKGRFSRLLERIPVLVILNDRTALLGAALLAARQAGYCFDEPPVQLAR